ncbi:hypothetical protein AA0535_1510 [Asaia krungthepensis NRIC 0535]|uniref:Uncharacterized protein n=1 Tax=Asaia krungthepensis NRIC 0535 TaxID=1307925 RepID=A0ABQ0Q2J9_9PROT|nr:hypothetical protein AA0535_1510 [Asaia krungthepensis NRIC 0535]
MNNFGPDEVRSPGYLQRRLDAGAARLARRVGACTYHYRVRDLARPFSTLIGTPFICFDTDASFRMRRPRSWGQTSLYALGDTLHLRVGDLLQQAGRFYFVAEKESLRPLLCTACNRQVTIMGMRGDEGGYVQKCPASISLHGRGGDRHSGMPGSLRAGSYMMHLPLLPDFCLMPYMQLIDETGMRYLVDAVELSQNGTRAVLSVQQV